MIARCSQEFGASIMEDKNLVDYIPAQSKQASLLQLSVMLFCPFIVNYYYKNTSSLDFLFEDQHHLTSVIGHEHQDSARTHVVI